MRNTPSRRSTIPLRISSTNGDRPQSHPVRISMVGQRASTLSVGEHTPGAAQELHIPSPALHISDLTKSGRCWEMITNYKTKTGKSIQLRHPTSIQTLSIFSSGDSFVASFIVDLDDQSSLTRSCSEPSYSAHLKPSPSSQLEELSA